VALVLIVDDDASVIDTLGRMLRLEGYDVVTALDAETAFREIQSSRPDAILVDLRMPGVDGVAFIRRLRAQQTGRPTPIAVITGDYYARETLLPELTDLDVELHFKPVWLADLVTITERLLKKNQ
jgi:two-component system response regulator PrrA